MGTQSLSNKVLLAFTPQLRIISLALTLMLTACQGFTGLSKTTASDTTNPVNQNNPKEFKTPWIPKAEWQAQGNNEANPLSQDFNNAVLNYWQLPAINQLAAQALQNNPDIQALSLRIQAGKKQLKSLAASRYPSVDLNLNRSRNNSLGFPSQDYQAGLDVSWLVDWWGQVADEKAAASFTIASNEAELMSLQQIVAAELSRHWIRNWQLKAQRQTMDQYLEELLLTKNIIGDSFRVGLGDIEDTVTIETRLASTKARQATLRQQQLDLASEVALLLGDIEVPNQFRADAATTPIAKPNIPTPPLTLPADTLAARPDIQQAYLQLQAEQFQTQAKFKALLPSLVLSANIGKSSPNFSSVLKPDSVWNFVAGISHPLIRGGLFGSNSLRQNAQAQELITQAQWWTYKKQVIKAIVEVETALGRESELLKQIHHLQFAQQQSQLNLNNWKEKYRQGLANILDLLQVQLQHREIQEQLIDTEAALLDNRIVLALALGIGAEA